MPLGMKQLRQETGEMKEISEIKQDLEFAAEVMRALPPVKVQGYGRSWPDFIQEEVKEKNKIFYRPSGADIEQMDKILEWLRPLNAEETRLVWQRANHVPWKKLCNDFKAHRSKLSEKYNIALAKVQVCAGETDIRR